MGGWPDYSMGVPLDPKNPWNMRRKWRLWVTIVWSIYLHETLKLIKKCRKNAPALLSIMGFLVAFIGYKFLPGALSSHNLPFSTQNIPFIYQLHQAPLFSVMFFFHKLDPKKGHWIFVQWNWLETWYHAQISCALWRCLWWFFWCLWWTLILSTMKQTMNKSPGVDHSSGGQGTQSIKGPTTSCFLMGPW